MYIDLSCFGVVNVMMTVAPIMIRCINLLVLWGSTTGLNFWVQKGGVKTFAVVAQVMLDYRFGQETSLGIIEKCAKQEGEHPLKVHGKKKKKHGIVVVVCDEIGIVLDIFQ